MIWKYYSVVFFTLALLFAGCSSHPPSAAQFMNANPKGFNFVIGGAARVGDVYRGNSHIAVDYIDKEDYGNSELSLLYRFDNFLVGLSSETISLKYLVGFRSRYVGVQGWAGMGEMEKRDEGNPFSGGLMLIEEYPVLDNLKVGISEHISKNAYEVDTNCGGLGIPSTYEYGEFGVGVYLTYEGFSFEFRYGREIGVSRNRFYFMLNYAFRTEDKSKPVF